MIYMDGNIFSIRLFFALEALIGIFLSAMMFHSAPESYEYVGYISAALIATVMYLLAKKNNWNSWKNDLPASIWAFWAASSIVCVDELPLILRTGKADCFSIAITIGIGIMVYLMMNRFTRQK